MSFELIDLWLIIGTLVLSAFSSGLEIAFLTSNKLKIEIDRQQGSFYTYLVGIFQRNQGQFITSILVGNNIAIVIYGIAMAKLLNATLTSGISSASLQVVINMVLSTLLILIFAEFLPKTICRMLPNFFLKLFSGPAFILYVLCFPVAKLATMLSYMIMKVFFRTKPINYQTRQIMFDMVDLQHLTDEAMEEGEEELEHDLKIFQNALDFSEVKVRECMVPRTEIKAIELGASVADLRDMFIRTNFSRILVYKDSIDHVIGYVKSSDLFKSYKSMKEMLKPITFVIESMSAQKLLTSFIKEHNSVAIVVDEFGGTSGMVTMEDVIEEIFGEIKDEHDADHLVEKQVSDSEYLFSGRLEVSYVNEKYGLDIPEEDGYETLAGFVIFNIESIPPVGYEFKYKDYIFRVNKTSAAKVELIQLIRVGEPIQVVD